MIGYSLRLKYEVIGTSFLNVIKPWTTAQLILTLPQLILQIMQEKKSHLLVLDEVALAVHWKLLDVKKVLELLDKVPEETTVVITGRYAPQELVDRADFVNIVQDVKMPKHFKLTEGIQY